MYYKKLSMNLVLILVVISLSGCGVNLMDAAKPIQTLWSDTEITPSMQPLETGTPSPTNAEGLDSYENSEFGFEIQYPSGWIRIDSSMSKDEILGKLIEAAGTGTEADPELLEVLAGNYANSQEYLSVWCLVNAPGSSGSNISLKTLDSGGISQTFLDLPEFQELWKSTLDKTFDNLGVEFTSEVSGKQLGENYFVFYTPDLGVSVDDVQMITCQVMTEKNGTVYMFTSVVGTETHSHFLQTFEEMLSTLEFVK